MGGNQSKVAGGGVRRQVEPLVPRSWAELVQLHLRFQQEAHRRKADPLFQYFLTFPVFQTIVAPLCPTKNKTQLMAIFAALDRKNAQKLAVMDFFSGLALLVDAKKPQKLEFLLNLLDNGGLETLNRCELAMVTSAAARGLALFAPGADAPPDTGMKPVIRRLFGEESEILRQTVIDKALADPEILFFMSDLEAGVATSSNELLAQQAKLTSHMAFLDLQLARVKAAEDRPRTNAVPLADGPNHISASQQTPVVRSLPTVESYVRKLQSLVNAPPPKGPGHASFVVVDAKKHVDTRTLQRLVTVISDGALSLSHVEAGPLAREMAVDQFGFARGGDIARVMKAWLQNKGREKPEALWEIVGNTIVKVVKRAECRMSSMLAALTARAKLPLMYAVRRRSTAGKRRLEANLQRMAQTPDSDDGELHWNINIRVGDEGASLKSTASTHVGGPSSNAVKFRLGIHPPLSMEQNRKGRTSQRESKLEEALDDDDDDDLGLGLDGYEAETMSLAVNFALNPEITDEEGIDLASSVERALQQEQVWAPFASFWTKCTVTMGSSIRSDGGIQPVLAKYLRVRIGFRDDFFAEVEERVDTSLFVGCRSFFVLGELDQSLAELVQYSLDMAAILRGLGKRENRERAMRAIFDTFDIDRSGDWSLHEFNAFQQALGKEALAEVTLTEVLDGLSALSFAQFTAIYESYSAAGVLAMIQQLGIGSLNDLITGSFSMTAVLHEPVVKALGVLVNPLSWADTHWKRLLFFSRSTKDLSLELQFPRLAMLVHEYCGRADSLAFLDDPFAVTSWLERLEEFVQPAHADHAKDRPCRSIFCSLEREAGKTQQQWDFDNQSRGLPRGTSAKRVQATAPFLEMMRLVKAHVREPEMLEVNSSSVRIVCEFDNLWIQNPSGGSNQNPATPGPNAGV